MTDEQLIKTSEQCQNRAHELLHDMGLTDIFANAGIEAHTVGSLAMGLLFNHLDIDLHVYSPSVTVKESFGVMASVADNECVEKVECRNLLNTEEACMEWHFQANDKHGGSWQIDIIHIVKGSRYDGFFERVADRIKRALTDETRLAILRLKSETPANEHIMGIEYYQAVLRDGVRTWHDFCDWRKRHAACGITEWMP